ncbi:MAG: hypothetical protein GY788_27195, partial [bacterium]|nr:hypothetical protein [bacterium]
MSFGIGRGGFRSGLGLVVLAWLLLVSSAGAVAQVDDAEPGPGADVGDDAVVVDQDDELLLDPGLEAPGTKDEPSVLRLSGDVPVDDPVEKALVPIVVSPIVVDDPLPALPVWEGNPELDRAGLTVGVSDVVVDSGAKRAVPSGSALSFEVAAKDDFPSSVRFEVETFKPELVEAVSPFGAAFRIDASVDEGVLAWDSPVDVVVDFEDLPVLHGAGAANRLQLDLLEGCQLVAGAEKGTEVIECKTRTRLDSVSDATDRLVRATLSKAVLGRVLDVPSQVEAFDLSG